MELWPSHVTLKMLGLQLQKQPWGYLWVPGTLRVIKGKSLRSALFRAYLPLFGIFLRGFSKNCYPVIGIRKQEFSMPDPANSNAASGNAPGGRLPQTKDAVSDVGGPVSKIPAVGALSENGTNELGSKPAGFGMQGEDVKGSLKIHIKIDLEADIRVIAKVKGDIAIGLL